MTTDISSQLDRFELPHDDLGDAIRAFRGTVPHFHSAEDLGPQTQVKGIWYARRGNEWINFRDDILGLDGDPLSDETTHAWLYTRVESSFTVDGKRYHISRLHMTVREIAKIAGVPAHKSLMLNAAPEGALPIYAKAKRGSRVNMRPSPVFITK